jgi:Flp pilus assembly pilin Flp
MGNRVVRLAKHRSSTLVEYGVIAALAGIAIIVGAAALGTSLDTAFGRGAAEYTLTQP